MELALNQLRKTVGKANDYFSSDDEKFASVLRSYVQDILEDVATVEKFRSNFKDKEAEILELVALGREVKRDMEKEAYSLEALAKRKETQQAQASTSSAQPISKLPRIKLPVFDGESGEDFRGFMDAFRDAISVDPNLGEVKKWLLLRAQLSGRALSLVKELPTAPETYSVAVQILEDTYGSVKRAKLKLYQRLQGLTPAEMTTESLSMVHAQMEGILHSLKHLKVPIDDDDFLRAVVISKYPDEVIHYLRVTDDTELATFRKEVGEFIRRRDCTIRPSRPANENGSKGGAGGNQSKKPRHVQSGPTTGGGAGTPTPPSQVTDKTNSLPSKKKDRSRTCVFCSGSHWNDECDVHKTLEERLKLAEKRCPKCLKPQHTEGDECKSRRVCYYCRDPAHNSALCPKKFAKVLLAEATKRGKPNRFITAVLPIGDTSRKRNENVRAILDTGGGRSLITEEMASRLELSESGNQRIRLVGINGAPLQKGAVSSRKLLLFPPNHRPVEIEVFVVPSLVEGVVSTSVSALKEKYPNYADWRMPPEGNGEPVHLLLGYRSLTSLVTLQNSVMVAPPLQLMSTKFGWIPFGGLEADESEQNDSSIVGLVKEEDPLKLMHDLELVGLGDFLKTANEEEELVLRKFYETIKRHGKQYEIEWPFRSDDPELEDNFGLAFGRLLALYKQLAKNPALLAAYDKLICEQLEEGVVEPVNFVDRPAKGSLVHYLPHRAVIRLGKSTPVRMVFDAAARCRRTAKSLNDIIMKGGNWVTEIPTVLLRFRKYSVAVTSDISKAFHQIGIALKDRDVVRFLWLRDPSKPPLRENLCVYRFRRMAFGVVASPFLLTATIRHHLRTYPNEFTERIERDMYADNLITSLPKNVDGAEFYRVAKTTFADMSMNLAQWATDDEKLRRNFTVEDTAPGGEVQGVLGLAWNTTTKEMRLFSPGLHANPELPVTKRIALKEMATVYDPLGWASPIVLKARLFLRRVWRAEFAWDAPLDAERREEWLRLRGELNQVAEIALPRPLGFGGLENARELEMHVFCDASIEAYGVVIYLCVREKGRTWTGLVAAKTRLTPKTKLSVPRLELLAAVTACRYSSYVERSLKDKEKFTKYLWSDSKCVIAWATSTKVLPALVERSVKQIKEARMKRFSYVPTDQNPADVASRGAGLAELRAQKWYEGPSWLPKRTEWPAQKEDVCSDEETVAMATHLQEEEEQRVLLISGTLQIKKAVDPNSVEGAPFGINPNDVQTVGALMRRTALCLRAAGRFLRGRGTLPARGRLNYRGAWRLWLMWDQQRIYEPAKRKTNVSYLRNLRASEDEEGLIRCETRIRAARVNRDEAEPILLVKRSVLTRLIILSVHRNNMHAGTAHTLAALRRKFWLPHGRREVYQTIREHCYTCRRERAQPFPSPPMAPLPEFRVNRTETPFTNVGIDAFGPYKVRVGKELNAPTEKRWVLLFTCMVTRAVHLEVLGDMTAAEFLNCLRRFAGRRGVPRRIICDNAPQFYAVEGYFQCVWRRFAEADSTEKYYAQHGIEWHFIPPTSPWMGGAYERLIKEVKGSFHRVYGAKILREKQFETVMIEVEGVINSRPITYVSKEADAELITPNDFLCVRYPGIPVDFSLTPNAPMSVAWREGQEYLEQFWALWAERYLRELRERRDAMPNQRTGEEAVPKAGELVIMVDPMLKRASWQLAVVERLIKSNDGQIRSVQLRIGDEDRTRLIRPVTKVAPLRLLMDLPAEMPELTDNNRAIVVDNSGGEIEV